MAPEPAVVFDRSVLGQEVDGGTFEVTREKVVAFARAVGETNPIYTDEKSAPDGPLFAPPLLVSLFAKFEGPEDLNLKFEGHDYLAGQYIEPLGVVRAGDALTCTAKIKSVYKKTGRSGPMAFVVREHLFINQRGEKVAVVGLSMVRRK